VPATEYVLAIGLYPDPAQAAAELRGLAAPGAFDGGVAGTGILRRDWRGSVIEQGGGGTLGYGLVTGAAGGLAVGGFLGAPLALGAVGLAIGGLVGRRMRTRETQGLTAAIADTVPVGATALIAVVVADSLPAVRAGMTGALRTAGRVLDEGPLTTYARSLVRGNPTVMHALDVQQGKVEDD
jgi:hypothetical protein